VATAVKHRMDPAIPELSHVDRIESVVAGVGLVSGAEEVAGSWRRSTVEHHIDPNSGSAPHILTESELRVAREPVANVVAFAQEEIDRLYAIVREAGYVVLLCNADGIAIHHRGNQSQAEEFKYWGIWGGGVWSEEVEGTNGIGTCITEQRPVVVHREQHYRTRHTNLSCSAAPIFDASGKLVSVLDSSSFNPEASDQSHALALAATRVSARAIEERLFRECFRQIWVIAAVPADDSGPALLIALDSDQRIVGADRIARATFGLDNKNLIPGVHLSTLFDHDPFLFRPRDGRDIAVGLQRTRRTESWQALITPPAPKVVQSSADISAHSRPRISTLGTSRIQKPEADTRGGLPPGLTRRMREYIDAHISENISLDVMAEMAALSVFHFARAFRQSFGVPPHSYLVRRRVEHAHRLLQQTELALSEIALSTGFSDHSHFAKHFRRVTGMTPSAARWQQR
jgi:transcriptional regulator of acetoin/glycerol metabolism/AraC-like DNA-binding protein